MKGMKERVLTRNIVDVKGWTITKGTRVFIVKESKVKNHRTNKMEKWSVVKIDNGTGILI